MFALMRRLLRAYAFRTGKRAVYRRFCNPTSSEWAEFLAQWGGFHHIGKDVAINVGCNVTDPAYIRLGNNITLSVCTLLGHDGVVRILNNRYGKKLDSVGMIDIRDNSFVGHGAIVMPRVTIGPDSVVAAGAVVTRDVPPGVVVGGNPARVICTTEELLARIEARCETYPWMDLIRSRQGAYDPELEPVLKKMRVAYFFGDESK